MLGWWSEYCDLYSVWQRQGKLIIILECFGHCYVQTEMEEGTNLVATVKVLVYHFTVTQLVYKEQIVCLIAWWTFPTLPKINKVV